MTGLGSVFPVMVMAPETYTHTAYPTRIAKPSRAKRKIWVQPGGSFRSGRDLNQLLPRKNLTIFIYLRIVTQGIDAPPTIPACRNGIPIEPQKANYRK